MVDGRSELTSDNGVNWTISVSNAVSSLLVLVTLAWHRVVLA